MPNKTGIKSIQDSQVMNLEYGKIKKTINTSIKKKQKKKMKKNLKSKFKTLLFQ